MIDELLASVAAKIAKARERHRGGGNDKIYMHVGQLAKLYELATAPRGDVPRLLDEQEVSSLARKVGMKKFMYDTSECRIQLASFANEANRRDNSATGEKT